MYNLLFKVFFLATFCSAINAQGQGMNGRNGSGNRGANASINGHFYGKIVDSKSKGIPGVTIQLLGNKFDTVTKQPRQIIVKTVLSENNGDFNLDGVPLMGKFTLRASAVGYKKVEQSVSFFSKMPTPGSTPDFQQLAALADKDLGNIKLELDAVELATVTVTAPVKQMMEMGIDRKVFNVDKNLNSTGQTATEIMKSIPSLSVDIDGNVSLRNAAPTIFIDGRPTTLTLDQIPADIIDKVEIITNPSAKFDASGGNAGILNIVLKKNRKNGYNGNVRGGIDSRGKLNGGGDINYRHTKINFTGSANYNQRKFISNSKANTQFFPSTSPYVYSNNDGVNNGHFQFYRAGLDYFINNRSTISIAGNYTQGRFKSEADQTIDTSYLGVLNTSTLRNTQSTYQFENVGAQLSFKHNFVKDGENFSSDLNYNSSTNENNSQIKSISKFPNGSQKWPLYQQQGVGSGYNRFFTAQADYENPLTEDSKFETGLRAAVRDYKTDNLQYINADTIKNVFGVSTGSSSRYKFTDQVFAAYTTYSFKAHHFGFQIGLRAESSNYKGQLVSLSGSDSLAPFKVNYPFSFFPSAFITYKLTDKQDIQLNYSRRINRPNFFQLLPAYDFSDPQNPSVGNPGLRPEFTNSLEWSYNNNYKKGANFLATAYFKYSTDLITRYVYKDINRNTTAGNIPMDSLYYTSNINANSSYTYGLELTNKIGVTKWWDLLVNVNFYNTQINATIPNQTISNNLVSWFSKINNTFKLPKGYSIQVVSEDRSKTIIPQSSGYQGGGRGMFFGGGGTQTLAQGFNLPRYFNIDVSIRKDWTWKKGQSGSLTLSMNDIFRSLSQTHTDAFYFTQETERYRDRQVARLNFSYRFGRFDVNLFKRKNTKAEQGGGMEMGGGN